MMQSQTDALELVWGVKAIAKLIGRTERQTFHLLSNGQLPAKLVGNRWVADRNKLIRFFLEEGEAA